MASSATRERRHLAACAVTLVAFFFFFFCSTPAVLAATCDGNTVHLSQGEQLDVTNPLTVDGSHLRRSSGAAIMQTEKGVTWTFKCTSKIKTSCTNPDRMLDTNPDRMLDTNEMAMDYDVEPGSERGASDSGSSSVQIEIPENQLTHPMNREAKKGFKCVVECGGGGGPVTKSIKETCKDCIKPKNRLKCRVQRIIYHCVEQLAIKESRMLDGSTCDARINPSLDLVTQESRDDHNCGELSRTEAADPYEVFDSWNCKDGRGKYRCWSACKDGQRWKKCIGFLNKRCKSGKRYKSCNVEKKSKGCVTQKKFKECMHDVKHRL